MSRDMYEICVKSIKYSKNLILFIEVQDFSRIISSLLDILKDLGDNVEKQKMAAIGAMNLLKSLSKDRESEQAKLQVLN